MMWFDTHCHLDMIEEDTASVLKKSSALGVDKMVTIGTKPQTSDFILNTLDKHPQVYGTLGIHPENVGGDSFSYIENMAVLVNKHKKIVAIGEVGFDFFRQSTPEKLQQQVCEKQLQLAIDLDMPVVIHSRLAENITIKTLEPFLKKGLRALFHSFTSNSQLFEFGLKYNVWFSYNGIATFKKADIIRDCLAKTPLSKILIETDAPFLAPEPYRGKTNIPGYVSLVGKKLASFLNIEEAEFAQRTWENGHEFYRI